MAEVNSVATFSRRLSFLALIAFLVAPLCSRWESIPSLVGVILLGFSVFTGSAVIVIAALATRRQSELESRQALSRSALVALIPVAVVSYFMVSAMSAPTIHDISTDTESPPQFEMAPKQRLERHNPLRYNREIAGLQRHAYPDITPIQVPQNPAIAFELALQTAQALGWKIHHTERPTRQFEAVDTTLLMGYRDDIVVRVRESISGTGSTIDIRSASRIGRSDMGKNAARIRVFRKRILSAS